MTNHRTERLRVAAPTLEPDPVFLGVLAELGASSQPAAPRTARTAGLRFVVATASVAVIAAATWAAGAPHGRDTPLSPADAPTSQEPSRQPSHGNVGTPQPDVSTHSPGSPLSPGLPGASTPGSEHASDRGSESPGDGPGRSGDTPRSPQGEKNGKNGDDHGQDRDDHGDDRGDDRRDDRDDDGGDRRGDGSEDRRDSSDERRSGDLSASDLTSSGDEAPKKGPKGGHGPGKAKKTR